MTKKTILLAGGGAAGLLAAAAAAALALAPERGPGAADLNQDGQITAAEIRTASQQKFAEADANKDGKLTADELPRRGRGRDRGGHQRGGHPDAPPPSSVAAAAQPGQAATAGQPAGTPAPAAQGQQAASAPLPQPGRPGMDADNNGAVTLAEFQERYRQRLARADANGDGTISAAELDAAKQARRGRGRH